ncbi:hypothetical protein [Streptomyces yaizuensis]|uniref:ATP-binding protein n=1 Tax=Streptomyces yaizuensis TaxID=2989713 RepID=A0ABQ5NVS1_9ACTN|nr:hypothetical protein [Streptomyces sp. YSPA8]GLF94253.1 ATP-binding protein [Streptomyces sp. YSPA8]
MKQSAARTLGVAALGAAFAAAAAGTAVAAPAPTPAPSLEEVTSLDAVTSAVPVQKVVSKLPAGAPQTLAGAQASTQGALVESASTVPATLGTAATRAVAPGAPQEVLGSLLGGLPVGELGKLAPAPLNLTPQLNASSQPL